ncbi:Fur family transcriptional regulator [Galbibacter pacificus]|uniref:Transcriptional repressor n=1 Tax=Galbibacter pacificus TaxID=2996052 RepID=A0ABT6FR33_9FLAO|nr:transcriptional repressor [Galbibacter pacificus]MDG3581801.1 transcriptional repressor [Galbibacter pacificus]MDG3585725.1 transcriptional repressor [Galbibacter pacificus]
MDTANIENKLKNKKIRPTAMRLLVYNLLQEKQQAISLTDIETAFLTDESLSIPVDRTTIYRTVKTFEKKGVVHGIEEGSGIVKYALCDNDCDDEHHSDMHLHFYCTSCQKTFCLTDHKIPKVALPNNYKVLDLSLMAKGICEDCNKDN